MLFYNYFTHYLNIHKCYFRKIFLFVHSDNENVNFKIQKKQELEYKSKVKVIWEMRLHYEKN